MENCNHPIGLARHYDECFYIYIGDLVNPKHYELTYFKFCPDCGQKLEVKDEN